MGVKTPLRPPVTVAIPLGRGGGDGGGDNDRRASFGAGAGHAAVLDGGEYEESDRYVDVVPVIEGGVEERGDATTSCDEVAGARVDTAPKRIKTAH